MKASSILLVIPLMSSIALAQNKSPIPQVGGVVPMVVNPQGDWNITNTEVTKLIGNYQNEYFQRQKDDKIFFEKSVNDIEAAFNKFYNDQVMKFEKLSKRQGVNIENGIAATDFVDATVAYDTARSEMLNKVQSLKFLSQGALPSAKVMVTEKKDEKEIPAWRSLNFDPIIQYYTNRITTEVEGKLKDLRFVVIDAAGVANDVVGFKIPDGFRVISREKRDEQQARINKLRKDNAKVVALQNEYSQYYLDTIEAFLGIGESNQHRLRSASDLEAQKKRFLEIARISLGRSYFRYKYGIPVGAIPYSYKKRWFNAEEFWRSPKDFIQFSLTEKASNSKKGDKKEQNVLFVRNKADLMKIQESYRVASEVTSGRNKGLFDKGDISLISGIGSLVTFVRGLNDLSECLEMALALLNADVHEEMLLVDGGRYAELKSFFAARNLNNDATRALTQQIICSLDPSVNKQCAELTGENGAKTQTAMGSQSMVQGSDTGKARELITAYKNFADDLSLANQMEVQLNKWINASSNSILKDSDSNVDDIFKK